MRILLLLLAIVALIYLAALIALAVAFDIAKTAAIVGGLIAIFWPETQKQ